MSIWMILKLYNTILRHLTHLPFGLIVYLVFCEIWNTTCLITHVSTRRNYLTNKFTFGWLNIYSRWRCQYKYWTIFEENIYYLCLIHYIRDSDQRERTVKTNKMHKLLVWHGKNGYVIKHIIYINEGNLAREILSW